MTRAWHVSMVLLSIGCALVTGRPAAGDEQAGFKPHPIRHGDGRGGWLTQSAERQRLSGKAKCSGFGLAQLADGELVLLGKITDRSTGTNVEKIVVTSSGDRGATWSPIERIPDAVGRPVMAAYLGGDRLTFEAFDRSAGKVMKRYFSADRGRTWTSILQQLAANGAPFRAEGNPWVDRDESGMAVRIAEIGYNLGGGGWKRTDPTHAFFRWSYDGGRTWTDEVEPRAWHWQDTYKGKTLDRCVSEGALVRAKNGWLVAALRPDMPARCVVDGPHTDNMEGLGVSISKDDGKTWSPVTILFDAGRMHATLVGMPSGDLVMTYVVRHDMRDGRRVSRRKGCEALISHDNGQTWDLARRYILDAFDYFNGEDPYKTVCGHQYSIVLDDGRILTMYINYTKGTTLIRWRPQPPD